RCAELFQVCTDWETDDISLQVDEDTGGSGRALFEVKEARLVTVPNTLSPGGTVLIGLFVQPDGDGELWVNGQQQDVALGDSELVPRVTDRGMNFLGWGRYTSCTYFQGVLFEFLLYERDL